MIKYSNPLGGGGVTAIEVGFTNRIVREATRHVADLSFDRYKIAKCTLQDQVVFAGGFVNGTESGCVDSIFPATDTIKSLVNLSTPVGAAAGVGIHREAIVMGGYVPGERSNKVQAIDVDTNTKKYLINLSASVAEILGCEINGEAVTGGGRPLKGDSNYVNAINPASNTKKSLNGLTTGRRDYNLCNSESDVFFCLGYYWLNSKNTQKTDIVGINVVSNTSKKYQVDFGGPSNPCAYIDGEVLLCKSGCVIAVDVVTATIREVTTGLPFIATCASTGVLDEKMIVAGGHYKYKDIIIIDPASNTLQTTPCPMYISELSIGGVVNEEMIFGGGQTADDDGTNYRGNDKVFSVTLKAPGTTTLSPLTFGNGQIFDTDVKLDSDCVYNGKNYPKGAKIPYKQTIRDFSIKNMPDTKKSVNGKYVIKKGEYAI